MKLTQSDLLLLCVTLGLFALVGVSCGFILGSKEEKPKELKFTSRILNLSFTYRTEEISEIVEDEMSEFTVILKGKDYDLAIKKLAGVGRLVEKDPETPFYQFLSGEVLYTYRDKHGMKLAEKETIEDFSAKGKKGAIQFMHFTMPENSNLYPRFISPDLKEVFLYYFHFLFPPDYWYFTVISARKLDYAELRGIIRFIEEADFQPPASELETK